MRKTFRYPADEETESVDSQPEAMDEEGRSLDALGELPHGGGQSPVADVAKQSRKNSSSASPQRIRPATHPSPRH
jgi:hypothetical protein